MAKTRRSHFSHFLRTTHILISHSFHLRLSLITIRCHQSQPENLMKTSHTSNLFRFIQTFIAALLLGIWPLGKASAQDYLGASKGLFQVEEGNASPAGKQKKDASAQLQDDLKSFRESVTNLAPTDAAQRWLDLVD